jgi:hypothetical protein
MTHTSGQREFARNILSDIAPDEEEFLDAYEATVAGATGGRRMGTGMGLPPEVAGALGIVAVWISKSLFEKLLEWSGNMTIEIGKKFVVDTGVDKLKKTGADFVAMLGAGWLNASSPGYSGGVACWSAGSSIRRTSSASSSSLAC